ncbi:hypothetical protein OG218_13780 [Kineococcus sp. NBC_00420]|uniref:hypothetical protein n=1 Tax=Kineococcus sp. NBC_00420 TaxID=2903564 RepID=UPI002E1F9C6A
MLSATRTTTTVAAALPLLFLSGGQVQQDISTPALSSLRASAEYIPADCYVTSILDHDSDTVGLISDLDAAQADLALQAKELTAHLPEAGTLDVWQVRAMARAADVLSRPDAHRSTRGSSAYLTAYDTHGQVLAEAGYGAPTQVFLNPTPADGYLLQSFTFPVEPQPGRKSCTWSSR